MRLARECLVINGEGAAYDIVLENTGPTRTNVVVQGWVEQGDTRRAGGGAVLFTREGIGTLPPGIFEGSWGVGAADVRASGFGSFSPGEATAVVEVKRVARETGVAFPPA